MRRATHILACWLGLAACVVGCRTSPFKPRPVAKDAGAAADTAQPDSANPANATETSTDKADDPPNSADAESKNATPAGVKLKTDGAKLATDAALASTADARQGPANPDAAAGQSARRQPPADSSEMLDALQELLVIGAIDRATQQRMIADLKQTDPALWPQLLTYFRASAMLHKKAEQRDAEQANRSARPSPAKGLAAVPSAIDNEPPADEVNAAAIQLVAATAAASPAAALSGNQSASASLVQAGALAQASQNALATQSALASQREQAGPSVPARAGANVAPEQNAVPQPDPATAAAPAAVTPGIAPAAPGAAARPAPENALAARSGGTPAGDDPNGWEDHLHAAIAGLENATQESPQSAAEAGRHAALRMLYMIDGRREDALKPIHGISPGQQDFWSQEVYGLANYLDTERNPDSSRRAAEAVDRLREAATKLGEQATLAVKNLAFCTEVTSFGVYKAFAKDEYRAGQEVLLYAEVENFKSRRDEQGYHTALRSSYQILDQHGARVESQDFEVTEEHCQNLRRDFFMRYHIWMPKRIYGGRYTLQLTIEDTLSQKIGQSSLEFTIKE